MAESSSALGCLLVHGFGGAPFEMEPLVEPLRTEGCAVRNVLLPGHDATPEEWARTGWADWYGKVEREYLDLRAETGRVAAVGLSMGGSLCLRLAQSHEVAGVATLAAPVWIWRWFPPRMQDWRLPLLPLLRWARPLWPTDPPRPESRAIAPWRGYEGVTALTSLASFRQGLRRVRRDLGRVACPLLVVHARGDRTAFEENAREIYEGAGSRAKRLVMLDVEETVSSRHVITTHRETGPEVAGLVRDFVHGLAR